MMNLNTKLSQEKFKVLELEFSEPQLQPQPRLSHPISRWTQFWHWLSQKLQDSAELRVWKIRDREGAMLWNAYDPKTGKFISDLSETEMKVWIENSFK